MRHFSPPVAVLAAFFFAFFTDTGAEAALVTGPFQSCQTSTLTMAVNGDQLILSDGTTFTAPAELQPTGDFSLQMVPGRTLRAIENQADLSCPGGSRIWLYDVPDTSGQPLAPIVAGLCLPDRLAAECYFSAAAAGSPQRIGAFTQQRDINQQRLTWIDLNTGQTGTSTHRLQIEPGSLRFAPSGTAAIVQHDLFNGPGFSDWAVIDLCPGSVGSRLADLLDLGGQVSAAVVEPAAGSYAARVSTPSNAFDVNLVDCLASTPPPQSFTLSVDTVGGGFGQVDDDFGLIHCPAGLCSATYADGTGVTLAAQPAPRSRFAGWSGDCSGTQSSTTVTLDADRACTARFELVEVDRGVSATALPSPAVPGATVSWTVTATNHSPWPSSSTRVRAVLPPEVSFDAAASSPECQPSGNAVACVLGDLAGQSSQTLTLVASIDPAARGSLAADFEISGVEPDPNAANDDASTLTDLRPEVDLSVRKRGPATAAPGGVAIWQIETRNQGPSSALAPSIVDQLPPGLSLLDDPAATSFGCTPPVIAPGARWVQTVVTRVDPALAVGTVLDNLASASAIEMDLDPSNDDASASLTVNPAPADAPGTLRQIARAGEQPAGTRVPFHRFGDPAVDGPFVALPAIYGDGTLAVLLQAGDAEPVPVYDAGQSTADGSSALSGAYAPSLDGGRVLATVLDPATGGAHFAVSNACGYDQIGGYAGFEGTLQGGRVAYLDDPEQGLAGIFLDEGATTTRIVSIGDAMPGSGLAFNFFSLRPALDGPYVAFWGYGPGFAGTSPYSEGIFVWDEQGGLRLIADLSTPIPGGTGNFARLHFEIAMAGETIFFFGEDSAGQGGLYAADAATGALIRLVDASTPIEGSSATLESFFLYPAPATMGSGVGVVFLATGPGTAEALYLWQDGVVRPLVANGHQVGDYLFSNLRIGPESFDGHRVAFRVAGFDLAGQVPFVETVWTYVVAEAGSTPPPIACTVDDFEDGTIDAAWTLTGVGNANQQSASEGAGALSLTADGATAFYGADNAGFLHRAVQGDFRLEATIDGQGMTTGGPYRKAGLMVRTGLDPWDARLLGLLVPYWQDGSETHLQFVARESYGTPGRLPVARDVTGVPRTVRLAVERVGNELAVEYSLDAGATWIRPSTGLGGSITMPPLPDTLEVGLAMVSNDISVTSTALFDDVSICPLP